MPNIVRQLARIASARAKGGVDDREYCVDFISRLGKSVFTIVIVAWRIGGGVALHAALSVGNVMAFTLRYAGDRYASGSPIDWELEAEVVARNSLGKRLYRDLAGFTPEQLEWMKRNRMAPAPYNPFWDDGRRTDEPGVLWINDDCAIVNLLPVLDQIGKAQGAG